jgi:NADH-quinone oxidoreductase subunit L
MARALRILWRGEHQVRHVTGVAWMGTGLAALVSLALILGLAFPAIEALVEGPLPKSTIAQIAGLVAALSGLGLGWFVGGSRLLGPLRDWARQGFVMGGGLETWVVGPSLRVARACEHLERAMYQTILAFARPAVLLARAFKQTEVQLYDTVVTFGWLNDAVGRGARRNDEHGIDGLIAGLVRRTLALGAHLRTLQSGLIHRELVMSGAGMVLFLVVVVTSLLAFT